jgi:hypothetical protein
MRTKSDCPSLEGLSAGLSRRELVARLAQVLQFARRGVARLALYSPLWESETVGLVSQADKVIVETALLALLASRVADGSELLRNESTALVRQLAPLARSERNQVLLLRFPHTAASLGIAHVALSSMGNQDDVFDAILRQAMASGHVDAVERLPYRAMDLEWLRGILEPEVTPIFDGLLPQSILSSAAHPIYMAETDAYAVTHALMYLTDFGDRALPAPVDLERVGTMVDASLAWHVLGGNFDLLGELVISAAVTRRLFWSPYACLAFQILMQAWDEFGFIPSPSLDGKHFRTLTGEVANAYAFRHTYHSTYVGGILCAVLLRLPECATPAGRAQCKPSRPELLADCEAAITRARAFCAQFDAEAGALRGGAAQGLRSSILRTPPFDSMSLVARVRGRIGEYPAACGRPDAPWVVAARVVEQAGLLTPEELALTLSDALLIQASRDYNLPVLVAALLDRAGSALPPSTSLFEATAFLLRQQLPSGAIGAHFVVPENLVSPKAGHVTGSFAHCLACVLDHLRRVAPPTEELRVVRA